MIDLCASAPGNEFRVANFGHGMSVGPGALLVRGRIRSATPARNDIE